MNAYVYQAALHCEDCGEALCESLPKPDGYDPSDEYTWDSDDYPKGPYPDGGGESGLAEHCDTCGCPLDNPVWPEETTP